MWRAIVLMLTGAALVTSAFVVESSKRKALEADTRGVAMLRTMLDSVNVLYASASNAADSTRLKKEIDERALGVERRSFHLPLNQQRLAEWWTTSGIGTWLSASGLLTMLAGFYFARRTARAQRRD